MEKIKLTYTFNTRDLGGLKTKDGKTIKPNMLIRSGCLKKLSEEDIIELKKHNLKTVIDFRSNKEFINKPDIRIDGVTYLNFPALKKDNLPKKKESNHTDSNLLQLVDKEYGGKKLLLNTYQTLFISEAGLEAYRNFFKTLLEGEGAFLWHCSQGKDRAGLAAFLLEYALGVSLEDCYKDYMLTNEAMELKIKELTPLVLKLSNNDTSLLPILREVFEANMEYLEASIKVVNDNYQSLDNFIENVLNVDVKALKAKFLI